MAMTKYYIDTASRIVTAALNEILLQDNQEEAPVDSLGEPRHMSVWP
jgi:hypothetical protein